MVNLSTSRWFIRSIKEIRHYVYNNLSPISHLPIQDIMEWKKKKQPLRSLTYKRITWSKSYNRTHIIHIVDYIYIIKNRITQLSIIKNTKEYHFIVLHIALKPQAWPKIIYNLHKYGQKWHILCSLTPCWSQSWKTRLIVDFDFDFDFSFALCVNWTIHQPPPPEPDQL